MKKRILITGGAGFIGAILKKKLESDLSAEILSIGRGKNEDVKAELSKDSFSKPIEDFLPEVVFHLASGSNIANAEKNEDKEKEEVVHGTEKLIKVLKGLKSKPEKIIYLSSQAVYGIPKTTHVSESSPTSPVTVYGKNKLKAENIIIDSGLNYFIFRVSSLYGASQNPNKSGVIAKFVDNIKNNKNPIVFNSLELYSDFIYVEDLIEALYKVLQADSELKNQIYNLGSGKPTTLRTLLGILYKHFPSAPKPKFTENILYPSKELKGFCLDVSKIKTDLKWGCKYSIKEGLEHMLKNMKLVETVK